MPSDVQHRNPGFNRQQFASGRNTRYPEGIPIAGASVVVALSESTTELDGRSTFR
jgi:hypothetical protein